MTTDDRAIPTAHQRPSRSKILSDMRIGAGKVAKALAVIVTAAAGIFAAILVLHVVFVLFGATPKNSIVKHVSSYAHDLAGPFSTLFAFTHKVKGRTSPNIKLTETVNYGVAAVAYLLGGRVAGTLLRKLAP